MEGVVPGGWSVLRDWSHRSWDPARVLSRLHTQHGAAPFFSVGLASDPARPGALLLTLAPGGLGLPDRRYYYAGPQSEVVVAYKRLMRDAVSLLGANSRDAGIFADDVFGYEQRLASIIPERSELMEQPPLIMSLRDLRMTTQSVPLQDILIALFPKSQINDSTKILLPSAFYIRHLSVVISTTDRSILNNYLIWTLVREYLPYMSSPFRQVLHEFTSHLTGSYYEPPRWEFCTSLLYNILPLAINAIIDNSTDEKINSNYKHDTLQNMFISIKTSAKDKIKEAYWITKALKFHLLQKLDTIKLEVELPKFTLNPVYLKEHYSSLLIQKHNLFENIRSSSDFVRGKMQKIFTSSLKSQERLIPLNLDMVNVRYYESRHAIVVPRLMANPPFYHPSYPISIQFGRLGVLLGVAIAGVILPPETLPEPVGRVDTHLSPIDDSIVNLSKQATNFSQHCLQNVLQYRFGVNHTVANMTKMSSLIHLTGVRIAVGGMEHRLSRALGSSITHQHIPGLDVYEDPAIFLLSYAQDQCDSDSQEKNMMENFINLQLQKKTLFQATWSQIPKFQEYLGCRKSKVCSEIL